MMYKIAVHVHVFYIKQWPMLEKYLRNIVGNRNCSVKIFVTLAEGIASNQIEKITKSAVSSDIKVMTLPNRGYDVEPFFTVLRSVSLDDFDFVIKMHTKNIRWGIDVSFNDRYISRLRWPKFLMNAIAGSPEIFQNNLEQFQSDSELGMIGSHYTIIDSSYNKETEQKNIDYFREKMNLKNIPFVFVAGTMFMIRAHLLKPLFDTGVINEEFEHSVQRSLGGTKAHALERIFGLLVADKGMKIKGFDQSWYNDFVTSRFMHTIRRFFFDKRVTNNGNVLIRIFRIPVSNKKYNPK